ncbi:MAG: TIR domain-containing protein, partial [Pirellulales bacterium]
MAYDVFLSYNSLDRLLVSRVAQDLETRGCSCFIDQTYLLPGRDWVAALEKALAESRSVAVFLGPRELGRWQQRERAWALDQQADNPNFPVIPVLLPDCEPPLGFLRQLMWIDLRQDPTDIRQLDALAATIRGEPIEADGRPEPRTAICPYRGLFYFREEDAAFFFGRDMYIDKLVKKVEQRALVAVVGASGSGKSSVVRAGLLPQLRSRDRNKVWEIVTMVPGDEPLHALAAAMMPLVEPDLSGYDVIPKRNEVATHLKAKKTRLADLVTEALKQQQGTDRLLLVVDQWEELYTQCEDEDVRQRFIDELLDATARKQSPLSVVLTVRSEFYDVLLQDRALLDRLEDGKLDLGPMTRDELRAVIEKPADAVGLVFQDGLVDRLLSDAGEEPGRLPLLEFAMEELWKRQD